MNKREDFLTSEISIRSDGYLLKGEYSKPRDSKTLLVLIHGIPMSRPDPNDKGYPELCARLNQRGIATVFCNLRGTGDSEGNFSMAGWHSDVINVMDYVLKGIGKECDSLFVVGFSAGASIALKYVSEHGGVSGVIAFASPARFTEIFGRGEIFAFIELAREIGIIKDLEFPPDPMRFFDELEEFSAEDFISDISPVPILIVHGDDDELIPVEHARRLFERAREPKYLKIIERGTHHLRRDPRSIDIIADWIRDFIS